MHSYESIKATSKQLFKQIGNCIFCKSVFDIIDLDHNTCSKCQFHVKVVATGGFRCEIIEKNIMISIYIFDNTTDIEFAHIGNIYKPMKEFSFNKVLNVEEIYNEFNKLKKLIIFM